MRGGGLGGPSPSRRLPWSWKAKEGGRGQLWVSRTPSRWQLVLSAPGAALLPPAGRKKGLSRRVSAPALPDLSGRRHPHPNAPLLPFQAGLQLLIFWAAIAQGWAFTWHAADPGSTRIPDGPRACRELISQCRMRAPSGVTPNIKYRSPGERVQGRNAVWT